MTEEEGGKRKKRKGKRERKGRKKEKKSEKPIAVINNTQLTQHF